jgi:glycosyltransferase involved in cell wall biosynthesis
MFLRYSEDTRGLSVYEIAKGLTDKGIEVSVVAPGYPKIPAEETIQGIKVHRFSYFFPRKYERLAYRAGMPSNLKTSYLARIQIPLLGLSFLIKAFRKSKGMDVLHAQWILSGLIAVIVGKLRKIPTFLTVRRIVSENGIMKHVNKYVLKNIDHVYFNSTYTQEKCLELVTPKRYSVARPTVNMEKFKPGLNTDILRQKYHLDKNTKVIISVGLLVEKKGFNYLIEAMKEINQHHKAILIIAGEGTERKKLEQQVEKRGLKDKVFLPGQIDGKEMPLYFNMGDMFVLPSIYDSKGETETFGVVILEAMACGLPVISTRVGGIPDALGDAGILIKEKDSSQIAKEVIKLLDDPKRREILGDKSLKRVKENFSWEKIAPEFIKNYQEVINNYKNNHKIPPKKR